MKKEKGITLIALIVSIIVMLILVVVTINIVFEGGLIDKAKQAKDDTELAAQNDVNMIEEAGDAIDEAVRVLTEFDFDAIYNNIYINPKPTGTKRIVFAVNATAIGDSEEREWEFDFDISDQTFAIQTLKNETYDANGNGTIQIETYAYFKEEQTINFINKNITIPAGWSHNNMVAEITEYEITGIQEGYTITAIQNSEIPVFSNVTFNKDREVDLEEEPTFEAIQNLINKYISDKPY